MKIQQEISGSDLHDLLWGQGLKNFESLVDDGADEDQILSAVEELLGGTSEMPDITAVNDMLWFEEDEIRRFMGVADVGELKWSLKQLELRQEKWLAKMEELLAENPDDEDLALLRDGLYALPGEINRYIEYGEKTDDLGLILDNLIEWGPNYDGLEDMVTNVDVIKGWFDEWAQE